MEEFFNEKSDKWIRIYKVITVALFWVLLAIGVIAGLGDATASWLDIGMGGDDDGLLDFIVWVILFGGYAFVQLVVNMLVIQLLNNVQIIREKMEEVK